VVARYGQLEIDNEPFALGLASTISSAHSAKSFGVGLNWYLSKNLRIMLDYEHTNFDGGSTSGDRPDENVILTRLQLGF